LNDMINTKEIERRAYLTYHKDGIIDIYLGLLIVMLSIVMLSTLFVGTEAFMMWGGMAGTFALFPIFYRESKKRYTFPRLGYVKFSEKKGRSRNSIMMLLGLGVPRLPVPGALPALRIHHRPKKTILLRPGVLRPLCFG